MTRVTDDLVHGFLVWARNYGEIESFERISERGRKWKIRLAAPVAAKGNDTPDILDRMFGGAKRWVPQEFVLTSREALTFGYGCAVAGQREARRDFAKREWGW